MDSWAYHKINLKKKLKSVVSRYVLGAGRLQSETVTETYACQSTFLEYRVKMHHSTLEIDTFKVISLHFYLLSLFSLKNHENILCMDFPNVNKL